MIASGVTNIVLLVVGAAWLAVLLPPLLRSRVENRPGSSIVDFRRQLASLQRTVPTRGITPMAQMARPLAPAVGSRRHGAVREQVARSNVQRVSLDRVATGVPVRSAQVHGARAASPVAHRHSQAHIHRAAPAVDRRRQVRQRRQNVLFALVGLTSVSAALAFATASTALTYMFVLSAVSLTGYCYKLVQLKNMSAPQPRPVSRPRAQHAQRSASPARVTRPVRTDDPSNWGADPMLPPVRR